METMIDVVVIAGIVLAITEFLKTQVNLNGFWVSLVVTVVVGAVAFFVSIGITFLTVLVALLSEVFGYQLLKNTGILSRRKKVGGGGGSFRPR